MNILIIDNSTAFTGALKCALSEAQLLSGQHRVCFLLPTGSQAVSIVAEKGFEVFTLPMREIRKSPQALLQYPVYLLANTFRLRKLVQQQRIDLVQCNDFYNLLGPMLKMLGTGVRLFTYVRFLPAVMPGPLRKLWTTMAQRHADRVIAVSQAVLHQLPPHPKNVCVYDPVFLAEKHPAPVIEAKDQIHCLYLGNYIPGKGQEQALEAFMEARKANPRLHLRFVGGDMGLAKNQAFKASLQRRVSEAGLESVVQFDGFAADVELAIKQADIVLNFSEAESFSMTCLEAAFYGVPLIATRCGGPEEIIDEGNTGLLVPVKDIAAMTQAIITLAGDLALRQRFSQASRRFVRQKFDTDLYLRQMNLLLNPS